ncbi:hypothetical protein [Acidovorax sp. Root267]|uniref:hypothetical protein n=1 Tax=Acidovorax sp. Root267 TaxID=1736505 RepID=UPI000AE71107|nr:hypothetical protein [Acidovorax sp. Root267]
MTFIFQMLYQVHPLFPLAYLIVLGNGVLAPAIYCAVRGIPYDITKIWSLAKRGQIGARYVVISWAAFAAASVLVLVLGAAR